MLFVILLIIAAIVGGFMVSSSVIVQNISSLKKISDILEGFRKPIGMIILVIGIINAVMVWKIGNPDYPLLTWIAVVMTGLVLLTDVLSGLSINDGFKEMAINFLNSNAIIIGIVTLIIGILKLISVFSGILNKIL